MATTQKYQFPADRETVLGMFTDKDYFLNKYERMGSRAIEMLDLQDDGKRFSIRVKHSAPQGGNFPGFVKKVIGERLELDQRDSWERDSAAGRIDIVIGGAPVTVTIDMTLVDNDGGCEFTLTYNVTAKIPVIGGKVASFVESDVARRMKADIETSTLMLEDYRKD